jgi:hypothetical protein
MNKAIILLLIVLMSTTMQAQLYIEPAAGTNYKPSIGYLTQWNRNFRPEVTVSYDLSYSSRIKRNMASATLGLLLFQNIKPIIQITPFIGAGYWTLQEPSDHDWQFVYGGSVGIDVDADFDSRLGINIAQSDRTRVTAFWRIYLWDIK